MSSSYHESIALDCPRCKSHFTTGISLIVDLEEQPDLLPSIADGTLHHVRCRACGQELGTLDAPLLLYYPMMTPPLVFSPSDQATSEEDQQQQAIQLAQILEQQLGDAWRDEWLTQGLLFVRRSSLPDAIAEMIPRPTGRQEEPDHAPTPDSQGLLGALIANAGTPYPRSLDGEGYRRARDLIEAWLSGRGTSLRLSDLDDAVFMTLDAMIADAEPGSASATRLGEVKEQFVNLKRSLYRVAAQMETDTGEDTDSALVQQLENEHDEELRAVGRFIRAAKGPHTGRAYRYAEQRYERATDLLRLKLGTEHPAYRASLDNLRQMRLAMGDLAGGAIPIWEARTAPFAREEDERTYAGWMEYFAGLYSEAHDYASAAQLTRSYRRLSPSLFHEPRDNARFTERLAELSALAGEYASAYRAWYEALEIYSSVSGERSEDWAGCAGALGLFLCEKLQNYREAGPLLHTSLEIYQALFGRANPRTANAHSALVRYYRGQSDLKQARLHDQECRKIRRRLYGAKNPDADDNLLNAALLADTAGDLHEAERLFTRLLNRQIEKYGQGDLRTAETILYLGETLHRAGAIADARVCYENCLQVRHALLGPRHRDLAAAQEHLAIICVEQEQFQEALGLLRAVVHSDSRHMGELLSLGSEQYRTERIAGMKRRVDMLLTLAVDYLDVEQLNAEADEQFARRGGQGEYQRLSVVLYNLILRRKGLIEAIERRYRGDIRGGRFVPPEHTAARMQRLSEIHGRLAQTGLQAIHRGRPDRGDEEIASLLEEKERLERDLARLAPPWSVDEILENEVIASTTMELPDNSALVEFVQYVPFSFESPFAKDQTGAKPPRYLAFVLRALHPFYCELVELGDARQIDHLIRAFREAIRTGGGGAPDRDARTYKPEKAIEVEGAGEELRSLVFDRVLEKLGGRTRLFISPDGELSSVPFEALPARDNLHLIDTYCFSYITSGREAMRFGTESDGRNSTPSLIIGAPNYDLGGELADAGAPDGPEAAASRAASYRFNSLAGTRREVREVSSRLEGAGQKAQLLVDNEALESSVKDCQSPRILHVATHGFFLPAAGEVGAALQTLHDLPLVRTGLALAGANTALQGKPAPSKAEDGILTAEDVLTMDLRATELVVLSACDTGLGEVRVGEGVLGLQRAFRIAGAWSLIMSLWKVPDQITYALIVEFYNQLLAGVSRAEALRNAQLTIKAAHPAPLHWAGFICNGLPSAMKFTMATAEHNEAIG